MDTGEFRAPESSCKSDQDKRGVPKTKRVSAAVRRESGRSPHVELVQFSVSVGFAPSR
jgi:hypothetical protein